MPHLSAGRESKGSREGASVMRIWHPKPHDVLPVITGFEGHFQPEWIWLTDGALLVAAPAHDTVHLLMVKRWDEMPAGWLVLLLRQVIKECRSRGFRRFMTWLSEDEDAERKLAVIVKRYGGRSEKFKGAIHMGMIP